MRPSSSQLNDRKLVLGDDHVGAELGCRAAERVYDCLEPPVRRIAMPDCPIPAAIALEQAILPSVATIVAAVTELMEDE